MFHAVIPTPYFKPYASLASPIVCGTDDPSGQKRHASGIYAAGSGTAVVRPRGMGSSDAQDRTLQLVAGVTLWVEFDRIMSGTATNLVLFWART
jgi:hypothetical protein